VTPYLFWLQADRYKDPKYDRLAVSNRSSFTYRPELDGLRGVAILAVLLFHATDALSGGFVGVDSFFVLSGFLISRMIISEHSRGSFSYVAFLERRVRRLFPAMAAMLCITLLIGYLTLMPLDLKALSVSSLANLFFASNIYFYLQSGYFDTSSELKPLLHTWSLSVEEQFYLLFPFLMGVLSRFSKHKATAFLSVLAILSFAGSVFFSEKQPSSCFYLLPTRAWELLVGVLIAYIPAAKSEHRLLANICSLAGMIMLVYSFIFFDSTLVFPGAIAGIPVVGTALVICSRAFAETSFVNNLLSFSPLRFIGLISYSLYLWHWPILFFARYKLEEFTWVVGVMSVSVSMIAATVSWWLIEQPIRQKRLLATRRSLFCSALGVCCLISVFAIQGHLKKGFPDRFEQDIGLLVEDTQWNGSEYEYPLTDEFASFKIPRFGTTTKDRQLDFLVWGDSHALATVEAFKDIANSLNLSGAIIATHRVAPVPWISQANNKDLREVIERNNAVLSFILNERPKTVFLVARWGAHFNYELNISDDGYFLSETSKVVGDNSGGKQLNVETAFKAFIKKLIEKGVRVVLVSQVPETAEPQNAHDFLMWYVGRKSVPPNSTRSEFEHQQQQQHVSILFTAAESAGATILDPSKFFFNEESRTINYSDGRALYRDDDHVTRWGAERLKESIHGILSRP
jgi:peptidoglycan/LPS O-acetylase OafA/YrhL